MGCSNIEAGQTRISTVTDSRINSASHLPGSGRELIPKLQHAEHISIVPWPGGGFTCIFGYVVSDPGILE